MITVIHKGIGRVEQRINGIYRSTLKDMPANGERVRVVIDLLNIEIDAVVCEVNESDRRFDVSLLENPYKTNLLLEQIRREENLLVESASYVR
jgi:hypothetical protein